MTTFILFLTTVGAVIYLKSLLGPNITASTTVGCRDTSPICVNASRSTSGDSNTSIEIRLSKWWSMECQKILIKCSWEISKIGSNGPHTFSSLLHFNIWWMGLSSPKRSSDRIQWDRFCNVEIMPNDSSTWTINLTKHYGDTKEKDDRPEADSDPLFWQ